MQEKQETIKIGYYIELVLRHRWFIIIPFCLSMIVGIYFAITLPKIYKASTLIFVEPAAVPTEIVRSIVSENVKSRMSTISQQIKSRTNLESIIKKFSLFSGPGSENIFMETKVTSVRKRIEVEVNRSRAGEPDTFSVSYKDSDPSLAMQVANHLAAAFIEENLKVREAQATGTSDFLDSQLNSMRKQLEDVENKLKDYRKRYMGQLPEQLEANLRAQDRLQKELADRQNSIRDAKNRLILLNNQIETNKRQQTTSIAVAPRIGQPMSLNELKSQLADLNSKYTDRHPDVISLKSRIKELEEKSRQENSGSAETMNSGEFISQSDSITNRVLSDQISQRQAILFEIANLQSELPKIKRQIIEYQQRVEDTPKREEELLTLKRDYENIQASYNSLLNRKLEADIAVDMEKKQKGQQFRIIDYARIPQNPISPDIMRLFLIAVAAGLGLGGGSVFLLDFFDTTVRQPGDFELDTGIAVLATIPKIYQSNELRLQRLNKIFFAFGVFIAICLLGGFGFIVLKGVDPALELVREYAKFFASLSDFVLV